MNGERGITGLPGNKVREPRVQVHLGVSRFQLMQQSLPNTKRICAHQTTNFNPSTMNRVNVMMLLFTKLSELFWILDISRAG